MRTISKVLSPNDTGATGGHQAGMLIPRDPRILSFFPKLDATQYNPRCHLVFTDVSGKNWEFAYIYYNNAMFEGTRNEYRLTRMTKYFREANLDVEDEVLLSVDDEGRYQIDCRRRNQPEITREGVLKLSAGWKIIQL